MGLAAFSGNMIFHDRLLTLFNRIVSITIANIRIMIDSCHCSIVRLIVTFCAHLLPKTILNQVDTRNMYNFTFISRLHPEKNSEKNIFFQKTEIFQKLQKYARRVKKYPSWFTSDALFFYLLLIALFKPRSPIIFIMKL